MPLKQLIQLTLGAIGIVFGDIGVSPLFVLKAVLKDESKLCSDDSTTLCGDPLLLSITESTILGYLSLIIWTLTLICCIKYIIFVLKADKNGEGGTFALISLLPTENEESALWKHKAHIFTGAMLSACFILADGFIAPSMAVLSAIEGMTRTVGKLPNVNAAMIGSAVVPTTLVILLILFMVQRFGTHSVEKFAWPVMVMWFLSIAAIGLFNIVFFNPTIFQAFSPHHIGYIFRKGAAKAFAAINHTVLAVVGVETLYADLGHFTTRPIRIGFLGVVYPALILSYLGQGSNIIRSINLRDPTAILEVATDPFFSHVPSQVQVPMVILATIAAIIASQATLSGCFSLLDQAISLGVFPNVAAVHENQNGSSAVYVPFFNYICMVMCLLIVGVFQHTDAIAEMYGICVTGSMLITSILLALVMRYRWEYKIWQVAPFAIIFGSIDLFFFAAAVQKIAPYGWIAILASFILFYIMYTWTTTTTRFKQQLESTTLTMSELRLYVKTLVRTQGTVAFVSNTDEDVPIVLNVCAAKLRALPENIVCMSAVCMPTPFIAEEERYIFRTIDPNIGLYRLVISYGYAERSIDTQAAIQRATKRGLKVAQDDSVLFVVGREIVKSDHDTRYLQRLLNVSYDFIARNSQNKADYFNLPAASTLEPAGNDGYWGPYVVSHHVAEWWNTLSSFCLVILSVLGSITVVKTSAGMRYHVNHVGMAIVGLGSAIFHGTLLYAGQLGDELPMIYGSCVMIFCLWNTFPPEKPKTLQIILLTSYSTFVTVVYMWWRNPVFHQVSYALLVFLIVGLAASNNVRLAKMYPSKGGILWWLFATAFLSYGFGFFVWNVENLNCVSIRSLRVRLGGFGTITQLHAWWHLFTALGTYTNAMLMQYQRALASRQEHITIKYWTVLPITTSKKSKSKEE
ncbi:potassium transporter-domain-containing protein [Cladochytrium replicatum]|nr:potassium transporter-domain-containing protein [Cladochytrium replicatum]